MELFPDPVPVAEELRQEYTQAGEEEKGHHTVIHQGQGLEAKAVEHKGHPTSPHDHGEPGGVKETNAHTPIIR